MSEDDRQRWNARYASRADEALGPPARFVEWLVGEGLVPASGDVLDVAAGAGRNAIFLASRGLDVDAVDISDAGLAIARSHAQRLGMGRRLNTRCLDLDACSGDAGLGDNRYDLVVWVNYKNATISSAVNLATRPGGHVAVELAGHRNLRAHARPSARFLVDDDEIAGWFPDLETVWSSASWVEGRYVVRFVGRKPDLRSL